MARGPSKGRKTDAKLGTRIAIDDIYLAAHRARQAMHQGEPDAGTHCLTGKFVLRAIEELEDLFQLILWDAGAVTTADVSILSGTCRRILLM